MAKHTLIPSVFCAAFKAVTVGTKVLNPDKFLELLGPIMEEHERGCSDSPSCLEDDLHRFLLPTSVFSLLSSGRARRTKNASDYVIRECEGLMQSYLMRELAEPTQSAYMTVQRISSTLAWLSDTNTPQEVVEEITRLAATGATWVIKEVMASPFVPIMSSGCFGPRGYIDGLHDTLEQTIDGEAAIEIAPNEMRGLLQQIRYFSTIDREWWFVAD